MKKSSESEWDPFALLAAGGLLAMLPGASRAAGAAKAAEIAPSSVLEQAGIAYRDMPGERGLIVEAVRATGIPPMKEQIDPNDRGAMQRLARDSMRITEALMGNGKVWGAAMAIAERASGSVPDDSIQVIPGSEGKRYACAAEPRLIIIIVAIGIIILFGAAACHLAGKPKKPK